MAQLSEVQPESIQQENAGGIWYALQSEREEIYAALNRNPPHDSKKILRTRLGLINDEMDRLMNGSYGHCLKCGGSIELDTDPAVTFCLACGSAQPNHESGVEFLPACFTSLNAYTALG
jgi:RNA polymerase-binding transcription factor DksA